MYPLPGTLSFAIVLDFNRKSISERRQINDDPTFFLLALEDISKNASYADRPLP